MALASSSAASCEFWTFMLGFFVLCDVFIFYFFSSSEPDCSKLTMPLVYELFNFQT